MILEEPPHHVLQSNQLAFFRYIRFSIACIHSVTLESYRSVAAYDRSEDSREHSFNCGLIQRLTKCSDI